MSSEYVVGWHLFMKPGNVAEDGMTQYLRNAQVLHLTSVLPLLCVCDVTRSNRCASQSNVAELRN